jgi:hypothetical protein
VANFFGAMAFFSMAFASCCPFPQNRVPCLSFYFFIACLFQGLTLLIFRSNACAKGFFDAYYATNGTVPNVISSVSCSLDLGSKLAVSACAIYFYCMTLVPAATAPPPILPSGGMSAAEAQEAVAEQTDDA